MKKKKKRRKINDDDENRRIIADIFNLPLMLVLIEILNH